MQRRFNPILDELPTPFCEDVYLLDKNGRVIGARQGTDRKINNIFSIIENSELDFVKENMLFFNIHPLFLVNSIDGVIILDLSLFNKKGIFMAIIPQK